MTIERAADAIIRSDWPGYREAFSGPLDPEIEAKWGDSVIDSSGAWETYAAQSARLARKELHHSMWIKMQIAMIMAVNTAVAFGIGVWWGRS